MMLPLREATKRHRGLAFAPVLDEAVEAKGDGKGSKKASGKGSKPVYAEITQDYLNAAHRLCSA